MICSNIIISFFLFVCCQNIRLQYLISFDLSTDIILSVQWATNKPKLVPCNNIIRILSKRIEWSEKE